MSGNELQANLTNTLRTISSKRRHGLLEISAGEVSYQITCHNGRIVRASRSDRPMAEEICSRLEAAGHPLQSVLAGLENVTMNVQELAELLERDAGVPIDIFCRAKNSYEFDTLYSLGDLGAAVIDFHQQMVPVEPEFSIAVSPGQLLLDLVEKREEEEQFRRSIGDPHERALFLTCKKPLPKGASDGEAQLWKLAEGGVFLSEAASRALLSEYELIRAVMALHAQGIIAVETRTRAPGRAETKTSQPVKALLRDTQKMKRDDLELGGDDEVFDELITGVSHLLMEMEEELDLAADVSIAPEHVVRMKGSAAPAQKPAVTNSAPESPMWQSEAVSTPSPQPKVPTVSASGVTTQPSHGGAAATAVAPATAQSVPVPDPQPSKRQIPWRYRLLEEKVASNVTSWIVGVFCLLLLWRIPTLLLEWFTALRKFAFD